MILYKKVREIPTSEHISLASKEDWTKFLTSINMDFDYMVEEGWLIQYEVDLLKLYLNLQDRMTLMEEYLSREHESI